MTSSKNTPSKAEVEVWFAVYEKLKGHEKQTGLRTFEIELGDAQDRFSEEKLEVLEALVEEKLIDKCKTKSEWVNFSYDELGKDEDVLVATAICTTKVPTTEFKKILQKHSLKPLFYISYHDDNGLLLNEETIKRPHSYSNIYFFWEYLRANANRRISEKEIHDYIRRQGDVKNPEVVIRKVVEDYGFTGVMKQLFFPAASKNGVYFVNPVLQTRVDELGISEKALYAGLKKFKDKVKK